MPRPRGGGLRHVSEILTDILGADSEAEPAPSAKRAIRSGIHPHRHCPCAECMRAYLASVEGKGESA